jgi:hypothetical protein
VRQLRLFTLTVCGLLSAAALARAHDMAFPGPPPGGMAGGPPPGAMMDGMYPGMQPVFGGPGYAGEGPYGPDGEPGAPGPGCCDDGAGPLWTVGAEALLWRRSSPRSEILVRNGQFQLSGAPLLLTDSLIFDHEAAPRITATLHVSPLVECDVTYFTVEDWSAQAVVVNDAEISISSPNILLDNFNAAKFDYTSRLQSAEVNLRFRIMPRITLLGGLRWMELSEKFEQTDNFPGLATFAPSYTIAVRNRLVGAQAGGIFSLLQYGPFSVDAFVKGGYFNNAAEQNMHDILNLGFGQLQAFNTEHTQLWEAGFNITWCFHPRAKCWIGYSALWLNGVATAPSQIPGNDLLGSSGVAALGPVGAVGCDVTDNLRVDGVNGGFEISY